MKAFLVVCVVFAVLFSSAVAGPAGRETLEEPVVAEHAARHRRVTCDILGINTPWGSLGHAACAAHCWALNRGFNGGYCDSKGICNCRS